MQGMRARPGLAGWWLDEQIVTAVRRFVWEGGGFVGVGRAQRRAAGRTYFQLADVLGVDKAGLHPVHG